MLSQSAVILRKARSILAAEGLGPSLRFLNASSLHRFTALYRFQGDTLVNVYLVDKEDPTVEKAPDLPVLESYCVYVRRSEAPFTVDHAREDSRVEGHPKQQVIQSYCGIPLFENGRLYGTLCNFDYEAIPVSNTEATILDQMAPDLIEWLKEEDARVADRV